MRKQRIQFGYSGLRVRDMKKSLRFYKRLGLKVVRHGVMEHGGSWAHLTMPGKPQRLELNYYSPRNRFYEPFRRGTEFDHLGFFVEDVDYWIRRMTRSGARLAADFSETRERLAFVKDPDGNWVEFVGPPRPKNPRPARKR